MQTPGSIFVAVVAAFLLSTAPAVSQITTTESETSHLSTADYIEIQQLVTRDAYALDTDSNDGYDYADLFAADGVFVGMNQGTEGRAYRGRETLAALARGELKGPAFVSHFITNILIEPSAERATGRQYAMIATIGESAETSAITHGGHYEDVYVKTPAGWRFQSRVFYGSETGAEPRQYRTKPSDAPEAAAR